MCERPEFVGFQKSEKPKAKQKEENANRKRQRNNAQTVGSVMICVMFLAFGFWQLFGFWLLSFLSGVSLAPRKGHSPCMAVADASALVKAGWPLWAIGIDAGNPEVRGGVLLIGLVLFAA